MEEVEVPLNAHQAVYESHIPTPLADYKPIPAERLEKQRQRYTKDKSSDDAYARLATGEQAERIASIFVDIGGGIYEHADCVPAELWSDSEINEYENLTADDWMTNCLYT